MPETEEDLKALATLYIESEITFKTLEKVAGMVMGLGDVPQNRKPAVPDTPAPPAKQED